MTRSGAAAIAEARAQRSAPRGRIQRSAPERRTYKGRVYASLAEAAYAKELDLLVGAGRVAWWEAQVPYELYGRGGSLVCRYVADFVVSYPNRKREVVEIKGVETPVWRLKQKLFRDNYPGEVLTVVRAR